MTLSPPTDVIDRLAGIEPGDALDALRNGRLQARQQAQQSYAALFEPAPPASGEPSRFTSVERFAVATFVAVLHAQPDIATFYETGLVQRGAPACVRDAVLAEASNGVAKGPYGLYPEGPLSGEDVPGDFHAVDEGSRSVLGPRLSAALAHAHLLVFHPRDADAAALQALLDAGWSTTDIVTLSQLVAFLAFQIRVVAGLRTLAAKPGASA